MIRVSQRPLAALTALSVALLCACGPAQISDRADAEADADLTATNLQVSASADRAASSTLANRTLSGVVYVYAAGLSSKTREVAFFIDDPGMAGAPYQLETSAPYDLAGTAADGRANPFDTALLSSGAHTLTVRVRLNGGRVQTQTVSFTVSNAPPMPNLTVTDIDAQPAEAGSIVFRATLTNSGDGATPAGIIHGVSFWVNGTQISWSDDHTASLAPGASVTVTANGGPRGTPSWVPTSTTFSVEAWVDDVKRIDESNETDNRFTQTLVVDAAAPSCSDGAKNGTESGVDCGGGCGPCEWPFDAVPRQTLRSSKKKVFAHWHYYPVAINNLDPRSDYYQKNWVNPLGESGKHAGYGGFMRERPLPRLPRPETDWLLRDMKQDVRLAAAIGIDGFFLNMWTDSDTNNGGLWTRAVTLVDAASEVGDFDIIPNFDMSILGNLSDADAHNLMLRMLGKLRGKSALYRVPDGRWVVGAFRAEGRSAAFYSTLKQRAATELQMDLYLVPVFLGTGTSHFSTYAPVSDALAGWGTAIPTSAGKAKAVADLAAAQGRPWIHPVGSQDFRPYTYKFWEARNTQTLRSHWETVIADGIDQVQIVTWNDHHEHHAIRPSTGKQWSAYDLTAYYIQWFKTGAKPTIKREVLYYNHRVHASSASYDTALQTKAFACVTGCPPADEIELVAFLTAPATLEISVGSATVRQAASAGMNVLRAPLATGRPVFRLVRDGVTKISLQSAFDIRASTTYQDLLYRGGSSARAQLSTAGTCQSFCEAGDAARCELCPAEPMWLNQ